MGGGGDPTGIGGGFGAYPAQLGGGLTNWGPLPSPALGQGQPNPELGGGGATGGYQNVNKYGVKYGWNVAQDYQPQGKPPLARLGVMEQNPNQNVNKYGVAYGWNPPAAQQQVPPSWGSWQGGAPLANNGAPYEAGWTPITGVQQSFFAPPPFQQGGQPYKIL